ncbi:MAG: tRNA (adenosine(37)-N6)-dimethylallyltransferase MiaA [Rectinemataceae bacterium]|jgi:tRNA dimethylallyltransferase
MSSEKPVVVLVGPTASGKTALLDSVFGSATRRAAFDLPEAEVISADSMQVYRAMDIGTAKPDVALRERIPHRLVDILEIGEQYTVGDFVRLADEACSEIAGGGKLPVVSGGTGFYVRNFLCGLPTAPAVDPGMRVRVARDLAERGAASLRAELAAVDPESAARIHGNDIYRLTRALEIIRSTGRPMADFASGTGPRSGHRFLTLGLAPSPGDLARRIDARVDAMMAAGLADEVAALRAAGHGSGEPGMRAIGYREFFELEAEGPAAIAERIKLDTRRYAKRQMTFFRGLPGIEWISSDPKDFASRVSAIVHAAASAL